MNKEIKVLNEYGSSALVVGVYMNEGPDALGNITDDSYDYIVEMGDVYDNGRFDALSHYYFNTESEFKEWIVKLYNTFVNERSEDGTKE